MALQSIEQASAAAGINQTNKTAASDLGRDEFLKLLTTQLQYQDPMEPMQNSEFTAQLAQFSSLEQLFGVNENLTNLASAQTPSGMASVAGFIDRNIVANGDRIVVDDNGVTPIQFALDGPSEITNISIFNADGVTVRQMALGAQPGGLREARWDGIDANGRTAPAGRYTFEVTAQDEAGSSVATRTEIRGRVNGAIYRDGEPYLNVGSQLVALKDVKSVTLPTDGTTP